jgi:hypothetical protein
MGARQRRNVAWFRRASRLKIYWLSQTNAP